MPQPNFSNEDFLPSSALVQHYEAQQRKGAALFLEREEYVHIIGYYLAHSKHQEALGVTDLALEQHAYQSVFYITKADILAKQKRTEEALYWIDKGLAYEPSSLNALKQRLQILIGAQRFEEASTGIEQLLLFASSSEERLAVYFLEAELYMAQKDYELALLTFWNILEESPAHQEAQGKAWICIELGELYGEAVGALEKLIDKDPYSAWTWYCQGHCFFKLGLWERSVESYDYAIVVDESLEFAYRECIAALFELQNYEKASLYLEEYVDRFQPDAAIYVDMGHCMAYSGQHKQALSFYARALQSSSLDGCVYYYMGLCHIEIEFSPRKALRLFEKAYSENPSNYEFCLALARSHDRLDNLTTAHIFYQKAIELAPEKACTWLAYLEQLIDEFSYIEALAIVEQAKDYCPETSIDCAKAAILFLIGRRAEGFACLEETLKKKHSIDSELLNFAPGLEKDESLMRFLREYKA